MKTTIAFQVQSNYDREPVIVEFEGKISEETVKEIDEKLQDYTIQYGEKHDDCIDFDDRDAIEDVLNIMGLSFRFFAADYTITY